MRDSESEGLTLDTMAGVFQIKRPWCGTRSLWMERARHFTTKDVGKADSSSEEGTVRDESRRSVKDNSPRVRLDTGVWARLSMPTWRLRWMGVWMTGVTVSGRCYLQSQREGGRPLSATRWPPQPCAARRHHPHTAECSQAWCPCGWSYTCCGGSPGPAEPGWQFDALKHTNTHRHCFHSIFRCYKYFTYHVLYLKGMFLAYMASVLCPEIYNRICTSKEVQYTNTFFPYIRQLKWLIWAFPTPKKPQCTVVRQIW